MVSIFLIFTPIWGRFPFWLICFKGVETTNECCKHAKFWGIQSWSWCIFLVEAKVTTSLTKPLQSWTLARLNFLCQPFFSLSPTWSLFEDTLNNQMLSLRWPGRTLWLLPSHWLSKKRMPTNSIVPWLRSFHCLGPETLMWPADEEVIVVAWYRYIIITWGRPKPCNSW